MNLKINKGFYIFLVFIGLFLLSTSGYAQYKDSLLFPVEMPENYNENVEYDDETNTYTISQGFGNDILIQPTSVLDFDEYINKSKTEAEKQFWRDLAETYAEQKKEAKNSKVKDLLNQQVESLIPEYKIDKESIGKIFGENIFDIRLQGYVELDFQFKHTFRDDKTIPQNLRTNTTFNLNNDIQVNADGSIGEKLNLNTDFLTKSVLNRRNMIDLTYTGEDDEIVKLVQLGNISMPMPGTLISGAQNLFGVKTQLQFGPTKITAAYSETRSENKSYVIENGGQKNLFEFYADRYDDNRHFFIHPYFYENYDQALENMPFVNSLIQITKLEVWVTNTRSNVDDLRDVLALTDIGGESGTQIPDNTNSSLDPNQLVTNDPNFRVFSELNSATSGLGLKISTDYEKIEKARKLLPTEYTFDPKLGYISLNSKLRDGEVLAVAFQYTYNGKVNQVGEFSDQLLSPNTLILKLLKPTILDIQHKTWKLMMKNIYPLNAYQIDKEEFELNILYKQPNSGTKLRYIPEDKLDKLQIIELLNLDNLNANGDEGRDGYFDFLANPKLTVDAQKGKVILPSVEPFGSYLKKKILEVNPALSEAQVDFYTFRELYDKTQNDAQQRPEKNRFIIKGSYKSQFGSEISLQGAFNLTKGSVSVKQGSERLIEGVDFIVDYNIGRVTILNEGKLNSGSPITVSVENESLAPQSKRFVGLRVDHEVSDELVLGGSFVSLRQAPASNKMNIGQEPISNSIWGIDGTYQTQSERLTKWADALPIYKTTQPSNIFLSAEFAQFLPGHPNIVNIDEGGTTYLDDFESGEVKLSIMYPTNWKLSSIPLGTDTTSANLFPEAQLYNDIQTGYNRAQLSWFVISEVFYGRNAPDGIKDNNAVLNDPYQRDIEITEIFENKDILGTDVNRLRPLNLVFDPTEPGPYNFDVQSSKFSSGLDADGKLLNPESRWGGIMQNVTNTDWEATNIEYMEFWLMDPFINNPDHEGGDFYINLGNISEDILQDSRKSFENGLPTPDNISTVDTTAWGVVSNSQIFTRNFDAQNGAVQDVGYDGLNDAEEGAFYPPKGEEKTSYLKRIAFAHGQNSAAYTKMEPDPAKDNFVYFFNEDFDNAQADIVTRYQKANGVENNTFNDFIGNGSVVPNIEDIDRNNTLNEGQSYYQYKVSLRKDDLNLNNPLIAQVKENKGPQANTNWYLFRIPIRKYDNKFGSISDFKSIRFIRFFLHGFKEKVHLRFGTFSTVRGSWRQYDNVIDPSEVEDPDANFQLTSVNIEEHANKKPYPYVLPPGIEREYIPGSAASTVQNEQSLAMNFCNLSPGKSKIAYRNLGVNLNNFKKLRLFSHLEETFNDSYNDGDVSLFIRLGTDYSENYYEYEVPLQVTKGETSNPEDIWPVKNRMEIELQKLVELKLLRNKKIVETTGTANPIDYTTKFQGSADGNIIYVKGNPNLGDVQNVMIGVRNNSDNPRCGEIWLNELRLSEFDEAGSIAFRGQFKTNLADLMDVNVSGAYTEAGFGALDQTISQRRFNTVRDFSANTTLNAGKLFPESWGVNLPVYYGITDLKTTPKFNPLDQDVLYKDALSNAANSTEKALIRENSETTSQYKSFNVTNFSVKPKMKKNPIYDPGNFNFTFSHTKLEEKSPTIKKNITENTKARVGYAYSPSVKPVKPFAKIKAFKKSKLFRPLKEFNFNYLPKSLTYSYSIDRLFKENQIRTISTLGSEVEPFHFDPIYSQYLRMDQVLGIKYDLTKSIKFSLNSTTNSVFEGENPDAPTPRNEWIDAIFTADSIRTYHQDFDASYKLPFQYFPMLNWISLRANYKASYDYIGANSITDRFGNTIQNNRQIRLNGRLSMAKLYNQIPFVRNYYGYKPNRRKKKSRGLKKKLNDYKSIKKKPKDEDGNILEGEAKEAFIAKLDKKIGKIEKKYKKELAKEKKRDERTKKLNKNRNKFSFTRSAVEFVTMLKSVDGTYSRNQGIVLPGFQADAERFGMGANFSSPTVGFVFGQQSNFGGNKSIIDYARDNKWIVSEFNLNQQYNSIFKEQISVRAKVEPIKKFNIDLNASRNYSINTAFLFKNTVEDPLEQPNFEVLNRNEFGQFDMTIMPIRTAFANQDDLFNTFIENRKIMAQKVANNYFSEYASGQAIQFDSEGFPIGFNGNSQEVIIPAFLATYLGNDVNNQDLTKFPKIPLPNWKLRYDGLARTKLLKNTFRRVSLGSSYRSTYTVGAFNRNLLFDQINQPFVYGVDGNTDLSGNFIVKNQINQVVISESFDPLVKVDITLKNNLTFNSQYKKGRTMTLNIDNSQMLDEDKYSYVVGGGFRLDDVKIFKKGLGKSKVPRLMEFKLNLSYTYSKTAIRNLYDGASQVSRGGQQFGLNASIDYTINEMLRTSIYFDRNNSLNFANASFGTRQTLFGLKIRYTLPQ
jgi:cell surface protein SprA